MNRDASTSSAIKPTVPELIESLGVGPAQVYVWALATGGFNFTYGMGWATMSMISVSAAADMNAGTGARGLLCSSMALGLIIGAFMAASGDFFGRLFCITTGYMILSFCTLMNAASSSWSLMVLFSTGMGFGMGFGLGPSCVMMSEMTPSQWKLKARVCCTAMYIVGVQVAALLAGMDDPNLHDLVWRKLLVYSAITPFVLAVLAVLLLPESPVFRAAQGRHSDACHGFQWMAEQNGQENLFQGYQELAPVSKSSAPRLSDNLRVVFSRRYAYTLFAATCADFVTNLAEKGRSYANPQIFGKVSTIPAAWEIIITDLPAQLTAIVLLLAFGDLFTRKVLVVLSLGLIASGSFGTVAAGIQPLPRTWLSESGFQVALMLLAGGCKLCFAAIWQLAVEIFHPAVSSTGSAVIMALGRLGAASAPLVFESLQAKFDWPMFYWTIASASLLAAAAMHRVPTSIEFECSTKDAENVGQAVDLLAGASSTSYGAIPETRPACLRD